MRQCRYLLSGAKRELSLPATIRPLRLSVSRETRNPNLWSNVTICPVHGSAVIAYSTYPRTSRITDQRGGSTCSVLPSTE